MSKFLVLLLVLPMVLGRVPLDLTDEILSKGKTNRNLEEIEALKSLTEELERTGEEFKNPLLSSLKVTEDDILFHVMNLANPELQKVSLDDVDNITSVTSFNTGLKTIIIIHGWNNNLNSPVYQVIGESLLNATNVNIIKVNWDKLASETYLVAFTAVPTLGSYVARFINTLTATYNYSVEDISIIGHSLGAHIAGFAGQETNQSLPIITALDPAGPLYLQGLKNNRLSSDDAKYVQAIHTDAALLGVNYNIGHADFWPNGGFVQPHCGLDITGTCAHGRSYYYFSESINSTDFIARKCDTYIHYTGGKCKNDVTAVMGGATVNTSVFGTYYLKTNYRTPFARGDEDLSNM